MAARVQAVEMTSVRRFLLGLIVLLPVAALGQSVAPTDLLKEDVPAADHRIAYGSGDFQFGELRLPKDGKGPHPVVMLVHGGCWSRQVGKMDRRATSLELLRPMAAALMNAGMATWNVEYRRMGDAGAGWPGSFEDLSHATDILRTLSPKDSGSISNGLSSRGIRPADISPCGLPLAPDWRYRALSIPRMHCR